MKKPAISAIFSYHGVVVRPLPRTACLPSTIIHPTRKGWRVSGTTDRGAVVAGWALVLNM